MTETAVPSRRWHRRGWVWLGVSLLVVFVLPVGLSVGRYTFDSAAALHWSEARNDTTHQAPDPATTPEAVIQVYAARAFSWRGAFGVHTWIAAKPTAADHYTRFEVIGFGVSQHRPAVRIRAGVPDGYWFGSRPDVIVERRGAGVDALIKRMVAAADTYPHRNEYRVWPGPNSNTFTAYIARQVPELGIDLPPNAIGKDYIPEGGLVDWSPSGTGMQLSLYGVAGVLVGWEEGLEFNLLGLTGGIDINPPALKLPGVGRLDLF